MAAKDRSVRFFFDNAGDLYFGRGFEILAALEANFKPDTFSHAFATLLSLVNCKQDEEDINVFRAHYEGHLHNMSWLMKDISVTTIDSIVLDAKFMDALSFFGSNGKPGLITDDSLDTAYPPELS